MISGMRLKRDYPLFYRHETFAKCLIASQGANIPAHMHRSCARRGTGAREWFGKLSESPKTGGIRDEGFRSVAKGFGERKAVSEVRIQFRRCSWGFGHQIDGGAVVR
jgi:hypothetical protein